MNTFSIKKYNHPGSVVDKKLNSLKRLSKSKKLPKGNTTLTNLGAIKTGSEFLEFFINDIPLSDLLNKFYNNESNILDDWTGVLGGTQNKQAEIIKIKQLLGKKVTDDEIRKVYPASWTDDDFEYYLLKYREELTDAKILIYCCAECGDPDCGGIAITMTQTENSVIWAISEKEKSLTFEFDKNIYFDILQKRMKYLENNIAPKNYKS